MHFYDFSVHTCMLLLTSKILHIRYRDGVKSKGDKIGIDYTHGTVG